MLVAVRRATNGLRDEQPFEPLGTEAKSIEDFGVASRPSGTSPQRAERLPMSTEHEARAIERKLARMSGWWHARGDKALPVPLFTKLLNDAGGIDQGKRSSASLAQLKRSWAFGEKYVLDYCRGNGIKPPNMDSWT